MVMLPDPTTALIDPFHEQKTMSIVCNVIDPITRDPYSRDPRYVAQKAEAYLAETGIADTCFMGPRPSSTSSSTSRSTRRPTAPSTRSTPTRATGTAGRGFGAERNGQPNLGYKLRSQQGYFPAAPADTHGDLRSRMVVTLESMGIRCEFHHHEVGSPGQAEINVRFQTLSRMGDQLQLQKYVVKNVAAQAGKTATFMPKPVFEENGSGMHVHISLGKGGENAMYDFNGYGLLSRDALNFIGGLLAHGRAVMAFCAPTTNSYRRLDAWLRGARESRVLAAQPLGGLPDPGLFVVAEDEAVEFRPPDPSANPYLAFSALLMAGLDGIQNRIDPGQPVDVDLFELPQEELARISHVPASLEEALDALAADHDFLLKGGVFTQDLIDTWIGYKRRDEADQVRLRPHPWEFALYYDA